MSPCRQDRPDRPVKHALSIQIVQGNATLPAMRILQCGDRAFLIELTDVDEVMQYHESLLAADIEGVVDLLPAARTIFVQIDPVVADLRTVVGAVETMRILPRQDHPDSPVIDIPIRYDGPDLADLSARLGMTRKQFVDRHIAQTWTVAFTGFAPGFAYLVSHGEAFDIPRLDEPRLEVPTGAVAMAGPFTGIYPRPSPGGWQLIGSTDARMWDLDRDPPALLSSGYRIRFLRED